MKAKDLRTKLKKSMVAEENTLEDRFNKAKKLFDGGKSTNKKVKESPVTKSFTLFKEELHLLEKMRLEYAQQGKLITQSDIVKMSLRALNELGEDKYSMLQKINK